MYSLEPFYPNDIFSLDIVNLDKDTENYSFDYYLYYLLNHSDDCYKIVSNQEIETSLMYKRPTIGYLIGKHEFSDEDFHAHVTALTVAPQFRKWKFGTSLMGLLEENCRKNGGKFIDLFVRVNNKKAVNFYKQLGYVIHKVVKDYYSSPKEDAYDMRLYMDPPEAVGIPIQ